MIIVREYRGGGPADGRTEIIQEVELSRRFLAFRYVTDGVKQSAIYRRAESASIKEYEYHFYDFLRSIPDSEVARVLNELEFGPASDGPGGG